MDKQYICSMAYMCGSHYCPHKVEHCLIDEDGCQSVGEYYCNLMEVEVDCIEVKAGNDLLVKNELDNP